MKDDNDDDAERRTKRKTGTKLKTLKGKDSSISSYYFLICQTECPTIPTIPTTYPNIFTLFSKPIILERKKLSHNNYF
jgi:hypothetical protein